MATLPPSSSCTLEHPLFCVKCAKTTIEGISLKRCAKCKTRYCSKECQKADWKDHKSICKPPTPDGFDNTQAVPAYQPVRCAENFSVSSIELFEQYNRTHIKKYLEDAIANAKRAVDITPENHPNLAGRLQNLGAMLSRRYDQTHEKKDLEIAIKTAQRAVNISPKNSSAMPGMLNNLSNMLASRYEQTFKKEDIDAAITIARRAVDITPNNHPDLGTVLNELGRNLFSRHKRINETDDLEAAISITKRAVKVTPKNSPGMAGMLNNLSSMLASRYERTNKKEDIDAAITIARRAVDITPNNHPDLAGRLNSLGEILYSRYDRIGEVDDLAAAIDVVKRAVDSTQDDYPKQAFMLDLLGKMVSRRYTHTGKAEDLEVAITYARRAVNIVPDDHPELVVVLNNMGNTLLRQYRRTSNMEDLEQAIINTRRAVNLTPKDHPDLAHSLSDLGNMVSDRYELKGEPKDLEDAIACARRAIDITPNDHPNIVGFLNNLGDRLLKQYQRTGRIEDLDPAIANAERVINISPENDPNLAARLNNLGAVLQTRFDRTGKAEDMEKAIENTQKAVNATPRDQPDYAFRSCDLANRLLHRFEWTGKTENLDEALDKAQRAVEVTPQGHLYLPDMLRTFSRILIRRFEWTGKREDLDEAVIYAQRAMDKTPQGHQDHASMLNNFTNALFLRYKRTANREDLEEAIIKARKEVHRDSPRELSAALNSVGIMLFKRYELTGELEDLQEAIIFAKEAVDKTLQDDPILAMVLTNLGAVLFSRYIRAREPKDLEDAIVNMRRAVDNTVKGHPQLAGMLINLGRMLSSQYRRTRNSKDKDEAIDCYEQACDTATAIPLHRIKAARQAIQFLVDEKDLPKASLVADKAVKLLPFVCGRYLNREDQQHAVSQTAGLAANACSLALSLKPPDARKALEHIEFGRGLILGYSIDNQDDLSEVEEKSMELAGIYRELRLKAEAASGEKQIVVGTMNSNARENIWREREQALKKLEDCQRRICDIMGYEQFPPKLDLGKIKNAAHEGPVVIVNATNIRCDAIIVQIDAITTVELPKMKQKAPPRFQRILGNYRAVDEYPQRHPREKDKEYDLEDDDVAFEDYLSWLWWHCVEPVFEKLQIKGTPAHEDGSGSRTSKLPRVWWIGTGAASSLPFHAAMRSNFLWSTESTMSRVISSYTPTLKALIYSQSCARKEVAFENVSILMIAMPTTPDSNPLPAVQKEEEAIVDVMEGKKFKVLSHPTAEDVLDSLKGYSIVHFACHGKIDRVNPSNSSLLLQKTDTSSGEISLSELTMLMVTKEISPVQGRGEGAWIAYLSACSTAEVRAKRFADEGLHLAAAFQVAGFANVIGSLQPADDDACAKVARLFYKYLVGKSSEAVANRLVAEALHYALSEVHRMKEVRPVDWAPYIHLGA